MNTKDDRPEADDETSAQEPPHPDVSQLITEDAGPLLELRPEDRPNVSHLITEDGAPVDSIYVEKQYHLLTDPLESNWAGPDDGAPFVALTNVALFYADRNPPLVPDFLLSVGVTYPEDLRHKEHRSYYVWLYGKGPDVVGEIVSDKRGGEDTLKLRQYFSLGVRYYFVFDPDNLLKGGVLRLYGFYPEGYRLLPDTTLNGLGLRLALWPGSFGGAEAQWLRWYDKDGRLIPTGHERADTEKQRADTEKQRADTEKQRADTEKQRADTEKQRADTEKQRAEDLAERLRRLEAQMRAAGMEPPA